MASVASEAATLVVPVRGWRKLAADSLVVGSATFVCQALGVVTSIAFRALLDPTQIGIWQALKLVLEYGNYASLGVSKGATRELTIALGRGEPETAERLTNLGFTFNLLTSVCFSVCMLLAAAIIWLTGATEYPMAWSTGLATMAVLAILSRQVSYEVTVLRARQAFQSTSLLNLIEAASMLVAGVVAVSLFGLPGLYIATAITLLASMALLVSVGGGHFRWHWDRTEIQRLAAIGAPILLIALGTTATRSLDRWMILGFSADRELELGLYSVALLMTTQLSGVANVFAIVMAPRYGELLGQCGQRVAVARLAARITELKALAMVLPGLIAMTIGPALLVILLPGYEAGLAAMIIRVPGAVARALSVPAHQLMITVDQQRRALFALAPPAIVGLGVAWLAYRRGWGLIGVAWAMTLSDLTYLVVLGLLAFRNTLDLRERGRYLIALLSGTVPLLVLALVRADSSLAAERPLDGALLLLPALAIWSCASLWGWRVGGWSGLWRKDSACEG